MQIAIEIFPKCLDSETDILLNARLMNQPAANPSGTGINALFCGGSCLQARNKLNKKTGAEIVQDIASHFGTSPEELRQRMFRIDTERGELRLSLQQCCHFGDKECLVAHNPHMVELMPVKGTGSSIKSIDSVETFLVEVQKKQEELAKDAVSPKV